MKQSHIIQRDYLCFLLVRVALTFILFMTSNNAFSQSVQASCLAEQGAGSCTNPRFYGALGCARRKASATCIERGFSEYKELKMIDPGEVGSCEVATVGICSGRPEATYMQKCVPMIQRNLLGIQLNSGFFLPVMKKNEYQNEIQQYRKIVAGRVMNSLQTCDQLINKINEHANSICYLYDPSNNISVSERAELAMFAVVISDMAHIKAMQLNCFK